MPYAAAIPALCLLAGAAVGQLLDTPPFVFGFLVLSYGIAGAICARALRRPSFFIASILLGFFASGLLLSTTAWQRAWRPPLRVAFERLAADQRERARSEGRRVPEDDEAFAVVEGVLRADASQSPIGASLGMDVECIDAGVCGDAVSIPATGGLAVTVVGALAADHLDDWRAGRRVRMPVQLRRASRYLDPGVPDHERALARRGTILVGTVKSGAQVDVIAGAGPLDEGLAATRAFSRRAIAAFVGRWSARSAGIVSAIVIGDRSALDPDVQRSLQEAGTYHVIAISGGNIAILAGLLLSAFRLAGWPGRGAMISACLLLVAYARLVGDGASVDRATLMALVVLAARAFDQRSPPLNALALVSAILVAADPLAITDPAFLLTCGATLAILMAVPLVDRARLPRVLFTPVTMVVASAAAEALLFPVGAMLFSRVTFAGLALNFLAIPLMGVAQVAGMAVVPLAALSSLFAAVAGWVAHLGAEGLVRSANLVRFAPMLTYRVAPPSAVAVIIYYSAAIAAWTMWRRNVASAFTRTLQWASLGLAVGAGLWILADPRVLFASSGDGRLHLTFLDVGQGDSVFIVFPRGSTLLVDAGGLAPSSAFDVGDRVVAPVIRSAGYARIDRLALTHGDPDHIGGALSILREFRPREVWEGIPVPRFEPLTTLRLAAQSAGARWANVYAQDHVAIDGVEVIARHPAGGDWERQKVRNDDSLVLDLRWKDVAVLLTGDVGKASERALAADLSWAPLRIIKVPHHGSLTSSSQELLDAFKPQIAVVSAGRNNHFGHPVPEVLERYRAIGTQMFRTDRDGAVSLLTDGHSLAVKTNTGRTLIQ